MYGTTCHDTLDAILDKAYRRQLLLKEEIIFLLGLSDKTQLERLFSAAKEIRTQHFGDKVFLYGFIYFSTWCRNDCTFCYYRKSNNVSVRYRKNPEEIVEAAERLADSGVHLIDLTMGEDPAFHLATDGFDRLTSMVRQVKQATGLPIMISPGVIPEGVNKDLATAGADWYACYQETNNRQLFTRLRIKQSYCQRYLSKRLAKQHGMLIEEGILTGVGETLSDIASSLKHMHALGAHQVRVMSFVPQDGNEGQSWPSPDPMMEIKIIAILRIMFPDRLIPASLDVDGINGLQARLNAGANVVTSLIPPSLGFAGVAQSSKDIDEGYRTVPGILPHLERIGMRPATAYEYLQWVNCEKRRLKSIAAG